MYIVSSVTSIEEYALAYCESLTSITFKGTKEQWKAIKKDHIWYYTGTGNYIIHCKDGDMSKMEGK